MIVDRNSTTVIDARYTLDLEYESNGPTGRLLVRIINVETQDFRETNLNLNPWSAAGYVVSLWSRASSIFIGGADRIVLLSLDDSSVLCSILYEYEEYETLKEPRMVMVDDVCFVASETRVTCIDRRNAIRWCWSVRMPPISEWTPVAGAPVVTGDEVRVPISIRTKDLEIALGLVDGARR